MLNIIIENKKRIISAAVLLAMALVSFFGLGDVMSSPETYEEHIESLDRKKEDVTVLTATAAAASTAVSFLPGDAGSDIADKLADVTAWFAIVLCIIYLEKYMLTILGFAAFKIIIPIALAILTVMVFAPNYKVIQMATKLIAFALIITFVVPAGETISGMIYDTYQETAGAQMTLNYDDTVHAGDTHSTLVELSGKPMQSGEPISVTDSRS